ncbi:ABC transporter substrate-binding protein [Hominifimenecus sp. rT4P-3]|uniref:ABC transporter substrate-binding protein n=1 Tax=Hominifimenecus sp. rT4P-3 TaxID=3242979 RepID=UPI003DA2B235
MKWMKKALACLLAASMAVSLVSCGGDTKETVGKTESGDPKTTEGATPEKVDSVAADKIIVEITADPGDMNPWNQNSVSMLRVREVCYETLAKPVGAEIVPCLAESWDWLDETHLQLNLRKGVKFHNGDEMKAEDCLFSLESAKDSPGFARNVKNILFDQCEIKDDYTLVLAYSGPSIFYMNDLVRVAITSKAAYEADPDQMTGKPIGTGPYQLTDWVLGSSLTFEKFDGYWDEGEQNVDTIVYRVITEATQRTIELETGGVDFLYDVPSSDLERLEANEGFVLDSASTTRTAALYFNCSENSVCQDANLRKAICYAIDTEAVAAVGYRGYGEPAYSTITPDNDEWSESLKQDGVLYAHDVEKAKEYLAAAGYADGVTINLIVDEDAQRNAAVLVVQSCLAEVGITMNIVSYESAVFQTTLLDEKGGWDILINNFKADGTIMILFNNQFDNRSGDRTFIHNEEMQALVEEGVKYGDPEVLEKLLKMFEEDLIPMYCMVNMKEYYAYKKGIENFTVNRSTVKPGGFVYTEEFKK